MSYKTISSFVTYLKTLSQDSYVNIDINKVYFLNPVIGSTSYKVVENPGEWTCISFEYGRTHITNVLSFLEPFIQKNGQCLILQYNGVDHFMIKSEPLINVLYTFRLYTSEEMNPMKTPLFKKEQDKHEVRQKIEQFKSFMDFNENDSEFLIMYLKRLCRKYEQIEFYLIGVDVFLSEKEVKDKYICIENKDSFWKCCENLYLIRITLDELKEREEKAKLKAEEDSAKYYYCENTWCRKCDFERQYEKVPFEVQKKFFTYDSLDEDGRKKYVCSNYSVFKDMMELLNK